MVDYPINVGGRPLGSWPAFLPPAIEMAVLGAVLFGVIAMLIGNGLPRLHHPLFGVPEFERASAIASSCCCAAPRGAMRGRERRFCRHSRPSPICEVPS